MYTRLAATLFAAFFFIAAPAKADHRVQFTASHFIGPSFEAPPDVITGAFEYFDDPKDFANPTLTKLELVVDGYTYTLADVTLGATRSMLFLNSIANFDAGNNAFYLFIASGVNNFGFLSPGRDFPWYAGQVDAHFSVVTATVPEPATYGILLVGLGLVGAMARRRRA